MNTRCFNRILASIALLVVLSTTARAELPTPTYGWNLGNTLEPPSGEGTWGPAATQTLINEVADSGFNTIRLPVAWDSHANQSTYVIDPAWMARVKQVVDWCYAKNLHVIMNCHWDGGWLENNITNTVNPVIDAKMQSYWTQIATAFAGYDNRLLFAGANEPNCDTAAQWQTLRSYYNTFISAVRATGGNNANRWLVISGPRTNIDLTYDLVSALPTDSATGRLMIEVHHYPWQWTLMAEDANWGKMFYFWGQGYHSPTMPDRNSTWGEEAYTDEQFQKMADKFVSQGVPVILGEWGAMKRTGYPDLTGTELERHLASRTYYSKYVTDKANALGLKPIWWDAGGTGSNTMWLFDRSTAAVIDPDNLSALTGGEALPPPDSPQLINVSIRAFAGGGEDTLIVGFYIAGTGEKTLLIRGLGPELLKRNVTNVVADPQLTLYSGQTSIETNDNADPSLAADFLAVGATVLDAGAKDAAMKVTLQPGGYTVHFVNPGPVAEAIVELFDFSRDAGTRLANLSSRLRINPGETAILGSFLSGNEGSILARNNGPALGELPVVPKIVNFIPDPFLQVFSGSTLIGENNNWESSLAPRFAAAGASSLLTGSKDAAIRVTVAPGAYTFHATGIGAGGVALIELFESP
jgi:endoglucanase